jgi:hypothetical protein
LIKPAVWIEKAKAKIAIVDLDGSFFNLSKEIKTRLQVLVPPK